MSNLLDRYGETAGKDVIRQLRLLARELEGVRVLHVNSTKEGGGVAEILHKMIPLLRDLGIEAGWEVITGSPAFYQCTKWMHNTLQGERTVITGELLDVYEKTNQEFAERMRGPLAEADIVFIHDPQPAAAIGHIPERKGRWVWRCHIDISRPQRTVWKYLRKHVVQYDSSIFSMQRFSQRLPHIQYLIPPSIDPLSEKNVDLSAREILEEISPFNLAPDIPLLLQVSRYDRFKDPIGVIEAYKMVRKLTPVQIVLAGGGASDDPEGEAVLEEVRRAAGEDPDIHVLQLPNDAHRTINALQRRADIIIQKSTKEGFGLTVTEGMWKGKPVIGGEVGGIRLQVMDHKTGFLVNSPEGAALRIRYLLHRPDVRLRMGCQAREFVRDNFLLTRHIRDYLALMVSLLKGKEQDPYLEIHVS
ncbi:MAG: glycosyltransferase [bacterium]|nr:glycosyltransferase [bacterium]